MQKNAPIRFAVKLLEQGALFGIGLALIVWGDGTALRACGVALLGLCYARNLELMHECLHNIGFASPRWNRVVGTVLGLPMLVSFAEWRFIHARHHADIRIEGFRYQLERLDSKRELLMHLFMVRHFAAALAQMATCYSSSRGQFPIRTQNAVRVDHLRFVLVLGCLAVLSVVARNSMLLWVWLVPVLVASLIHTHIELPEHWECDHESTDPLLHSRIMRAGRFVTWLVNYNNYHALHHRQGGLALHELPALYGQMVAETASQALTYRTFYRQFYARYWQTLSRKRSVA